MRLIIGAAAFCMITLAGCGSSDEITPPAMAPTPGGGTWSDLSASYRDVLGSPGCAGDTHSIGCITTMQARLDAVRTDAATLEPSPAVAAALSALEEFDDSAAAFVDNRCDGLAVGPVCVAALTGVDSALHRIQAIVDRQAAAGN